MQLMIWCTKWKHLHFSSIGILLDYIEDVATLASYSYSRSMQLTCMQPATTIITLYLATYLAT